MKDFIDSLAESMREANKDTINSVMQYIADKIQGDVVGLTYSLLDQYYENYSPEYYIRIDDLGHSHLKNKKGQFRGMTLSEQRRARGKSLRNAVKSMGENGLPLIGVAGGTLSTGYQAGVIFREDDFANDAYMQHIDAGISEWDIVNNFLYSDSDGRGNHPKMQRSPEADAILIQYINNYDKRFDKHYKDACRKFR